MTEKEKMLSGQLYHAIDADLMQLQGKAKQLTYEYNQTNPAENEKRSKILKELFGSCSDLTFIEPTFRCDFGFNIHTEGLTIVNYNCVMLDTAKISLGANLFIGPGTCLSCASHPIDAQERGMGYAIAKPITIEEDVWIGANCTILGGVTIGKGSIIGAGSVVTKDIPAGVVAVGSPCKVLRNITPEDKMMVES